MWPVEMVVCDVGETLVNEDRAWADWADWLGVSPAVFCAALGATIARGEDHSGVFGVVAPGSDPRQLRADKQAAGRAWPVGRDDLYPDAVPCLQRLRQAGIKVGIAGNQPATIEPVLAGLGVPLDLLGSSERWRVSKPAPEFFRRILDETGLPAELITYVGDRLDNDVLPAQRAGMRAVLIRRGPWGFIHSSRPEAQEADAIVNSLDEVVSLLVPD